MSDHLVLRWWRKPHTGYFLRAESFYNVATEIERVDANPDSPPLLPAYGGVCPHERSHGEFRRDYGRRAMDVGPLGSGRERVV